MVEHVFTRIFAPRRARSKSRPRFKTGRRFARAQSGAVAVEFAMVSLPLILLFTFFIEFSSHLFINSILEHGVESVARQLRTNQITAETHTREQFLDELFAPDYMSVFDRDKLQLDVRSVAQFRDLGVPVGADGSLNAADLVYAPGGPNSINVVRAFYEWPTFIAYQAFGINDLWQNGNRLMTASAAFQIEP